MNSTCLPRHPRGRNDTRDVHGLNVWFRIAERRPAGALVAQHRPPDSPAFIFKSICQVRLGGSTSTCLRRHRAGRNDTRDAPSLNVWVRIVERRPAGALVAQYRPPDSAGVLVKYICQVWLGGRPLPTCAAIARVGMTPAMLHH